MTIVANSQDHRKARAPLTSNPFIPISAMAQRFIIVYFIGWRIVPAMSVFSAESSVPLGHAIGIIFVRFATECLLLLPFIKNRFAGAPIGWLHPLVMIPSISIIFGILRNPASLLQPFLIWTQVQAAPSHILLPGWSDELLLDAQLLMNIATLIASVSTLAGFTLFRLRWRRFTRRIALRQLRLGMIFLFCTAVVFLFLQHQGGVLNHMATFAGGRFGMRETAGQFLVLNAMLPYILLLWYLYRPTTLRNWLFIAAALFAVMMQFVLTGSRSGLITPIAAFLMAWMYVNRKVVGALAILLGLVAILLLNVLGEIRRSGRDGEVNFSSLSEFNIIEAWEASQQELRERAINADFVVFAMVPEEVGHIHGITYLAAIGFMIPRAIWRNKPRGGGAYAAALLFERAPTADHYRGAAYPINGVAEAYWSFNLPGVILIFLFYGLVIRVIVDWVCFDPDNPFAITALILLVLTLDTPSTDSIISFLQAVTIFGVIYLFAARRIV